MRAAAALYCGLRQGESELWIETGRITRRTRDRSCVLSPLVRFINCAAGARCSAARMLFQGND
jgi:hypothetical protein